MLNNIRLHTSRNNLYFNLVDVGKLLNRRPDSLCRAKYVAVKSFTTSNLRPANYTNEASFKILFKNNKQILDELEQYKQTGAISKVSTDLYSDILTAAFFIAATAYKADQYVLLPYNKPLSLEQLKANSHQPQLIKGLIMLYIEALFHEPLDEMHSKTVQGIFKSFPVKIDQEQLYKIYLGEIDIDPSLIKNISNASVNILKIKELGSLLLSELPAVPISETCKKIAKQLYGRFTKYTSSGCQKEEKLEWGEPQPLSQNWYCYPISLTISDKEGHWLGE